MPLQRGVEAYNSGNYDEAARKWTGIAQAGDARAQYNMGLLWAEGLGSTPRDPNQAMEWFLKAANQGFVPAMVALARVQLATDQPDPALSWLNLAARWNDATAIGMLGSMGAPVPQPDLFAAQQQANAQAAYLIGCLAAGGCAASPSTLPVRAGRAIYRRPEPLQREWLAGTTDRMCQYANGTVLNVGSGSCPETIAGK